MLWLAARSFPWYVFAGCGGRCWVPVDGVRPCVLSCWRRVLCWRRAGCRAYFQISPRAAPEKKSTFARNGRPLSPIDLGGGLWYDMRPFGAVVVPALNGGINYVNRTESGARRIA